MIARGPHTPDRAVVERIVAEEARRARVSVGDVLGESRVGKVVRAKRRAAARITASTGCSTRELARVWGMSLSSVQRHLRKGTVYDPSTLGKLAWIHGEARARQIAMGRDPATLNDLAAWRRLCALGGAK